MQTPTDASDTAIHALFEPSQPHRPTRALMPQEPTYARIDGAIPILKIISALAEKGYAVRGFPARGAERAYLLITETPATRAAREALQQRAADELESRLLASEQFYSGERGEAARQRFLDAGYES